MRLFEHTPPNPGGYFQAQARQLPGIVQHKILWLCVRVYMQIKVTKELWVVLVSI